VFPPVFFGQLAEINNIIIHNYPLERPDRRAGERISKHGKNEGGSMTDSLR
jgi:hypothetical protein